MIEWKKLPRSYRLETAEKSGDVWQYAPKRWKYTVFDNTIGHFTDEGFSDTLDGACALAQKSMMV